MPYLKHRYGRTYYLSKGRKSGKIPLIGLHGGPGGTLAGLKPLFRLADDRKVYIYDQIGGGKSSATSEKQWKIPVFVEELDRLIDHWGLDEFHLYGGSWGTTLALEYYLRRKGRGVKSIIFQSPLFSTRVWMRDADRLIRKLPKQHQKVIRYCHEIGATDSKVYREALLEYYSRFVLRNRKVLEKAMSPPKGSKRKNPNAHGNKVYEFMWGPSEFGATGTLKTYEREKDLRRIKVPVLLMGGHYDEATPEAVKRFAKKIPDCRVKIIPKASHAILKEQPTLMLKYMREFMQRVDY